MEDAVVSFSPSQGEKTCLQTALSRFGFTKPRGLQAPAIRSVLAKKDSLVLMPTGGGKSLCYQLPAIVLKKLVVVVCPLLALMEDQVQTLRERGIVVEMLCSKVSSQEKENTYSRLLRDAWLPWISSTTRNFSDRIELLYTTPETLQTSSVRRLLGQLYQRNHIALFAIDEAHCISMWGQQFRPAYDQLGQLRIDYPQVPIMALTASATLRVQQDIVHRLHLDTTQLNILRTNYNRPNITYTVVNKNDLHHDIVGELYRFIKRCHENSTGIIYVLKRIDTVELCKRLKLQDEQLLIAPYHARMTLNDREQTLNEWLNGKVRIICATIAFGMGIDHPHVRFVVHWNIPRNLENLYQESGRAGRDGKLSHSILMYSDKDYSFKQFVLQQKLRRIDIHPNWSNARKTNEKEVLKEHLRELKTVQMWAKSRGNCRRVELLRYFGQEIEQTTCNAMCDICSPTTLCFDGIQPVVVTEGEDIQVRDIRSRLMDLQLEELDSDEETQSEDLIDNMQRNSNMETNDEERLSEDLLEGIQGCERDSDMETDDEATLSQDIFTGIYYTSS